MVEALEAGAAFFFQKPSRFEEIFPCVGTGYFP